MTQAVGIRPELREQIDALTEANREQRSVENERRIRALRHEAGAELFENPIQGEFPEPDGSKLTYESGIPEAKAEDLSAELIRAAILDKGCLLVRGLVDRDEAKHLEGEIEKVFQSREKVGTDEPREPGYYEQMQVNPPYELKDRDWVNDAGGCWAADSPKVLFDVMEMIERNGLTRVIGDYLGEPPAFSVQKCTLRKVPPSAGNGYKGWHQDGRFLGDVRALNVWLTLTHCGDDAPGLDLIPRRFNDFLPTGTPDAVFHWVIGPEVVEEARGDTEVIRPVYEPGDVMLFDDVFLHCTGAEPTMPNNRYAIESWFFGPSGFPGDYAPMAL